MSPPWGATDTHAMKPLWTARLRVPVRHGASECGCEVDCSQRECTTFASALLTKPLPPLNEEHREGLFKLTRIVGKVLCGHRATKDYEEKLWAILRPLLQRPTRAPGDLRQFGGALQASGFALVGWGHTLALPTTICPAHILPIFHIPSRVIFHRTPLFGPSVTKTVHSEHALSPI